MVDNTENGDQDRPDPIEVAGSAAEGGTLNNESFPEQTISATAKDGDGGGDAAPSTPKDDEEEEDDAALARMMAFQEEQQPGDAAGEKPSRNGGAAVADRGGAADPENVDSDPNVAFLGDDAPADGDGNGDGNGDEDAVHPNLNNPAAVALRQRQALQNAARLNPNGAGPAALRNQPYLVRKLFLLLRPSLRYIPLSLLAAGLLVHHTLRTRQQFFLALVYLQSSKLAYILLGNAVIALAVSTFSLLTKLFLDGGLRPNERDSIGEHIRWDVTETCLALTIFRSELDVVTAIEFLGLVILKCLHWSVELRGGHLRMTEEVFVYPDEDEDEDHNENNAGNSRSQSTKKRWYQRIPRLRLNHIRYYSLVQFLLLIDIFAVAHCALSVATHGPSVDILFGFECAILLISGLSAMCSYHLHVVDGIMGIFHHLAGEHHHVPVGGMAEAGADENEQERNNGGDADGGRQQQQQEGEENDQEHTAADALPPPPATRTKTLAKTLVERFANPWRDRRATYSFAIELQAQAAKFLFYVVFFAIVFTYYGMPINIFREVYVSFQQLRRRLIAFNTYRRLTHNMDERFEDIKDEEELDRLGHTCIICRDQMDLLGGCKKLPGCGHAFHTHCLREWLVQQQTCPTCRADIAANEARAKKQKERDEAAAVVAAAAAAREAGEAGAEVANGAATADTTTRPTEGSNTDANVSPEEHATSQVNTAVAGARPEQQPTSSTTTPGDALPAGWTRHVDPRNSRTFYYNKELRQTSWEKPDERSTNEVQSTEQGGATSNLTASNSGSAATNAASKTIKHANTVPRQDLTPLSSKSGFPCLYQITSPSGTPIFSPRHSPENHNNDNITDEFSALHQRIIPRGKLIVCTAIAYWPHFQTHMLCMPDGYVSATDVERFLMLAEKSGGEAEEGKRRALGVGR